MGYLDLAFLKRKKTLEEIRDENERKQAEEESANLDFSIAQKRAMIAKLKQQGVSYKSFSNNGKTSGIAWSQLWNWFKTH